MPRPKASAVVLERLYGEPLPVSEALARLASASALHGQLTAALVMPRDPPAYTDALLARTLCCLSPNAPPLPPHTLSLSQHSTQFEVMHHSTLQGTYSLCFLTSPATGA